MALYGLFEVARVSGGCAGGGASGSATLETLMDKMPFRPKPKVVDLTSERKLADKVLCQPPY